MIAHKTTSNSFLSIRNVSIHYGSDTVLKNLDLDLVKGEIGCLLGSSGCGKTTLLRSIAGFERPQQGSITLNNHKLVDEKHFIEPENRGIGLVFQDFALFPHLTVEGNIAFGLNQLSRADRQQRVREILQLINLSHTRKRYPHQLSGGQQQRIALARALAPEPELLLLDEPFSSLDVELREQLAVDIRAILKKQKISAILVTHDQQEAFMVADKIGLMHQGEIIQWSTPYDLYHKPVNNYAAGFIGKGSILPGKIIDNTHIQTPLGILSGDFDIPSICQCSDCNEWMSVNDSHTNQSGNKKPAAHLQKGCHVGLLIRPDDIVHDDNSDLKLPIVNRVFKGNEFIYTLKIDDQHQLLCTSSSHHNHQIGDQLRIKMEVKHIVLLKDQDDLQI